MGDFIFLTILVNDSKIQTNIPTTIKKRITKISKTPNWMSVSIGSRGDFVGKVCSVDGIVLRSWKLGESRLLSMAIAGAFFSIVGQLAAIILGTIRDGGRLLVCILLGGSSVVVV